MALQVVTPPTPTLRTVHYTPTIGYNPRIGAFQVVGTDNVAAAVSSFLSNRAAGGNGDVALDIETTGVGPKNWWNITCVTAAFRSTMGMTVVLLNPLREPEHRGLMRKIVDNAQRLVFHNSTFDIPPLVAHRLLTYADVDRVWDTIVLARMLRTSARAGRSLEDLSSRYKLVPDDGMTMAKVFGAGGFRSAREGYANMDLDSGTYRDGAMSDTVVTLRLLDILHEDISVRCNGASGSPATLPSSSEVHTLIAKMQRVNQITLKRSARGYRIDPEYRDRYEAGAIQEVREASNVLMGVGLEPGRGDKMIEYLHALGELPLDWPRTPGGKLSADKKALARLNDLGHPLTQAHKVIAEHHKVIGYLDKVIEHSADTGRLHPEIGILGAAASGRMSVRGVELHQFPGVARKIILADEDAGWSSVDWSSIEPVTMAICAGDTALLDPFYAGQDLYIPVARTAGLIPPEVDDEEAKEHKGRKVSKVVVLAGMYGQGGKSLASNLSSALKKDVTVDEAFSLKRSIVSAMPDSFTFMSRITAFAEQFAAVSTIMGRVLDEDAGFTYRAVNHFCITLETPILTADLRHVRADSVGVGDELAGFDEHRNEQAVQGGGERRFRTATVKAVHTLVKPSVEVHTDDGNVTVCSTDHRWLVRDLDSGQDFLWARADSLTARHELLSVGTHHPAPAAGSRVHPANLESTPRVLKVVSVGDREVVAIETSTHTFIANGYLSHNCQGSAADLLYEATLLIDKFGLADHIHLWMHDELVCSTEFQDEIERAMQTPPESLLRWARVREVKLRTDAKPIGRAWDTA